MNQIYEEEIQRGWKTYQKKFAKSDARVYVYAEDAQITEYFAGLFSKIKKDPQEEETLVYTPFGEYQVGEFGTLERKREDSGEKSNPYEEIELTCPLWIVCWIDAASQRYCSREAREETLTALRQLLDAFPDTVAEKILVCTEISSDMLPPATVDGRVYAELEYGHYIRQCKEHSREHFLVQIEDLCREKMKTYTGQLCMLRVLNPVCGILHNEATETLRQDVREAEDSGKVETIGSDTRCYYTSMRTAMTAMMHLLLSGDTGNIYQVYGVQTTKGRMAFEIYDRLGTNHEGMTLSVDKQGSGAAVGLHTMKLRAKGWKPVLSEKELLRELIETVAEADYLDANMDNKLKLAYAGKLELIKKLEMQIMREIDRICKKHDIKYFLVGGSLLGAVRHKGYIPWDDDLDIGMLREDYDKFRKICPKELSERFAYQSYLTEKDSHYIFDKIRLKDTYFSTQFSNRFIMENGIFVDILVYDKTSNNPGAQKRHINMLSFMNRVINIRWVNYPRKKVYYWRSKIMLPFMRLIPFSWYHSYFEHLLKKYHKSGKSRYLIDGVGQNLRKGAFLAEWVQETVDMPFEDMMLPVPVGYHDYLVHWYGENYMDIPPLGNRFSGHSLARIDLGAYVFEEHTWDETAATAAPEKENMQAHESGINPIDLRGELYVPENG